MIKLATDKEIGKYGGVPFSVPSDLVNDKPLEDRVEWAVPQDEIRPTNLFDSNGREIFDVGVDDHCYAALKLEQWSDGTQCVVPDPLFDEVSTQQEEVEPELPSPQRGICRSLLGIAGKAAMLLTALGLAVADADDSKPKLGVEDDTPDATLTSVVKASNSAEVVGTTYLTTELATQLGLQTIDLGVRYGSLDSDLFQVGIMPSLNVGLDDLIVRPILAGSRKGNDSGGKVQLDLEFKRDYTFIVGGVYGEDHDDSKLGAGYGICRFPGNHVIGLSYLEFAGESEVRSYVGIDLTEVGLKDLTIGGGTHFMGEYYIAMRQAGKESLAWRAIAHLDPSQDMSSLGEGLRSFTCFVTDKAADVTKNGFIHPKYYTATLPYLTRLKGEDHIVSYQEFLPFGVEIPLDGARGRYVLAGKLTGDDEVLGAYVNPLYPFPECRKTFIGASYGFKSGIITPVVQVGVGPVSLQVGYVKVPHGEDDSFIRLRLAKIIF